jgi:hypothetical protein
MRSKLSQSRWKGKRNKTFHFRSNIANPTPPL